MILRIREAVDAFTKGVLDFVNTIEMGFHTNVEEAVAIANQSKYGLSGCVFTRDWKLGMDIARRIESGGVVANGTGTYRNMMQPFGGMKQSGQGKEGFFTLGEVVEAKNIVLKGFLGNP